MAKVKLQTTATIEETFKDFIVSKRSKGLAEKTLESYQFHFHSIAKHLDVTQDVAALQKEDLEMMIAEMRGAGMAANSILSYTRTLKSFFSWCNAEGITTLNIPLYKGEETVKETYTDKELAALLKNPTRAKAALRSIGIGSLSTFC